MYVPGRCWSDNYANIRKDVRPAQAEAAARECLQTSCPSQTFEQQTWKVHTGFCSGPVLARWSYRKLLKILRPKNDHEQQATVSIA